MNRIGTVEFKGKSGKAYSFNIYPLGTECPDESGIYIFGNLHDNQQNGKSITPIYIGMAESFVKRFYAHHKEDEIKKAGANVICLMQVKNQIDRIVFEKDLLSNYNTKCNEVNNSVTA